MPFGLTYAMFAGAIALGLLTHSPGESLRKRDAENGAWLFSLGKNDPQKRGVGINGLASIEYFSEQEWFGDFKPIWAASLDPDGGGFVSLALRKDFYWGPVQISPYIGPALHQRDLTKFDMDELFQFRTGIDVMYPLTDDVLLGIGFFHMSNSQNNDASSDVDVTRFSIVRRF